MTPRRVRVNVRLPHEFSMDKPDPSHPVPVHLCSAEDTARAIKAAAAERVAAYRQMNDLDRLGAHDLVLAFVKKWGAEEVQCWVDEGRVTR